MPPFADFWRKITDFIFPKRCLGCKVSGEILCLSCLNAIPKARQAGGKVYPALDYHDKKLKKALWLFKYGGYVSFAETFGKIIYDKVLEEAADVNIFLGAGKFIVVPIPLSPAKFKKRGFNQSELMAREVCKLDSSEMLVLKSDILIKTKETGSQMSIRQKEKRLRNLAGAFAVKDGANLRGKNLIIIDDIITTGATINEATKVLKEAGANEVIAFTVAH